eukprot:jgi/Mesen1/6246/ME000323S05377
MATPGDSSDELPELDLSLDSWWDWVDMEDSASSTPPQAPRKGENLESAPSPAPPATAKCPRKWKQRVLHLRGLVVKCPDDVRQLEGNPYRARRALREAEWLKAQAAGCQRTRRSLAADKRKRGQGRFVNEKEEAEEDEQSLSGGSCIDDSRPPATTDTGVSVGKERTLRICKRKAPDGASTSASQQQVPPASLPSHVAAPQAPHAACAATLPQQQQQHQQVCMGVCSKYM